MKWLSCLAIFLTGCGRVVHGDEHNAEEFVEQTIAALEKAGMASPEDYASNEILAMALLQRPCFLGRFEVSYVDELFYEYMFNVSFPESDVSYSVFVYKKSPWSRYQVTGIEFAGRDDISRQALRTCLGEDRFLDWMNRKTEKYLPGDSR